MDPFFVAHYGMNRTVFHFRNGARRTFPGYVTWTEVQTAARAAVAEARTGQHGNALRSLAELIDTDD
jgi:hypothetical protein